MTFRVTDECTGGRVRGRRGKEWVGTEGSQKRISRRRRVVSIINIQEIPKNEIVGS